MTGMVTLATCKRGACTPASKLTGINPLIVDEDFGVLDLGLAVLYRHCNWLRTATDSTQIRRSRDQWTNLLHACTVYCTEPQRACAAVCTLTSALKMSTEPDAKKQRVCDSLEIKYAKIFINNEWVDSGEGLVAGDLWCSVAPSVTRAHKAVSPINIDAI